MQSLHTVAGLRGKKVFLRVDFNVPVAAGKIQDNTRILSSLPTIEFLLQQEAIVIIATHFDRPEGRVVESMRLDLVAQEVEVLLGKPVRKLNDCIGEEVKKAISSAKNGSVLLLENLRFHPGEENCSPEFSAALASLADIYVNDAFGAAHRAHASTFGVAGLLPAYPGLLLERELSTLSGVMTAPRRPLTLIFGGAKIETKLGMIKNFAARAEHFLLGGGLANTFLAAAGYNVGDSLFEANKIDLAQETMLTIEKNGRHLVLPQDAVVASEISPKAVTLDLPVQDIEGDMKILDIGSLTVKRFSAIIRESGTVIWNGPLGLYEVEPFAGGTRAIISAIAASEAFTVIGGGDTIDCLKKFGHALTDFDHVSTGGGAMLQFLSGEKLPGVEALK